MMPEELLNRLQERSVHIGRLEGMLGVLARTIESNPKMPRDLKAMAARALDYLEVNNAL